MFAGRRSMQHDPGGRQRLPLLPGMEGEARFAGDNQEHRIWLLRQPVGVEKEPWDYALWIGRNPSTADKDVDDMTIRKELGFTKQMGFKRYIKTNFSTWRATYPQDLLKPGAELSYPTNEPMILNLAAKAAAVIVACGNLSDAEAPNALKILESLVNAGEPLWCLGLTNAGWPKHSSRLAYATEFERYEPIF
jgi:hypothetical protein